MGDDNMSLYGRIVLWIIYIVIASPLILIELSIWVFTVSIIFRIFGIEYTRFSYLVPFVYMSDGTNVSIPILIAVTIGILFVLLYMCGGDNVKSNIIMVEIFVPMVVLYAFIWIVGVCFILKILGYTSHRGMIIPLVIIILIHLLLLNLAKIKAGFSKLIG